MVKLWTWTCLNGIICAIANYTLAMCVNVGKGDFLIERSWMFEEEIVQPYITRGSMDGFKERYRSRRNYNMYLLITYEDKPTS